MRAFPSSSHTSPEPGESPELASRARHTPPSTAQFASVQHASAQSPSMQRAPRQSECLEHELAAAEDPGASRPSCAAGLHKREPSSSTGPQTKPADGEPHSSEEQHRLVHERCGAPSPSASSPSSAHMSFGAQLASLVQLVPSRGGSPRAQTPPVHVWPVGHAGGPTTPSSRQATSPSSPSTMRLQAPASASATTAASPSVTCSSDALAVRRELEREARALWLCSTRSLSLTGRGSSAQHEAAKRDQMASATSPTRAERRRPPPRPRAQDRARGPRRTRTCARGAPEPRDLQSFGQVPSAARR